MIAVDTSSLVAYLAGGGGADVRAVDLLLVTIRPVCRPSCSPNS